MKGNRQWVGFGQTVGAFALGATAGSIIALLYAPASGRATRKRIGLKFRTLERSTGRQLLKAKKLLAKKAENLREAASEKLGNTREWLVERVGGNGKHSLSRRVVHHA